RRPWTSSSPAGRPCPASAPGPRTTSPCACSAIPMRSRPATWCCRRRCPAAATAWARKRCAPAPRPGAPGAATPPSTCGAKPRPHPENDAMSIYYTTIDSPIGPLLLAASDEGLHAVEFHEARHPVRRGEDWREGDHPGLRRAEQQLREYFAGDRRSFDLPLAPRGTPFQREVWQALATIPYGETRSYGQLAATLGRASASWAVG